MNNTIARVVATDAALQMMETLRQRHGPLMFFQSGGCCDGSAPMCYALGEFNLSDTDVYLGNLHGTVASNDDVTPRYYRGIPELGAGASMPA